MTENFFDSEQVQSAICDIVDMQNEVLIFAQYAEYASIEQQRENLVLLRSLHAKQENMVFRCMLSEDPDAKALLGEVLGHFAEFGHVIDPGNPMQVFAEVKEQLQEIEDDLNYAEEHGYFPGEEPGGETPPSIM